MKPHLILMFIVCSACILQAAALKEYLVISSPAAAELYNQYEQRISPSDKARLPVPLPLKVVAKKQLMGDQITTGMKLSYNSETYYLMLDDKNAPAGLPPSAGATFYTQCTDYSDTVTTVLPQVTLSSRYPTGGTTVTLAKGVDVTRLFSTGQATFVVTTLPPHRNGWVRTTDRTFSKRAVTAALPTSADFTTLHLRIVKHLNKINSTYDSLFTFFSTHTGRATTVPSWRSTSSKGTFRYTLSGTPETVAQLSSSTSYVVGEIERMLLGKPFQVQYVNGTITILPRKSQ